MSNDRLMVSGGAVMAKVSVERALVWRYTCAPCGAVAYRPTLTLPASCDECAQAEALRLACHLEDDEPNEQ
jgi:hypothetical protein